ncbi:MAG TPA: pitrilysin family protein [Pirellulaceae bacterium]|nr:pitrilysin family protein [Pirellulaceae bacterium]HMO92181.1 pitrilysin family protein [Pirellulaceae bacterium]HMP68892.1 pitrilysin family protein [Pirellulaceae bacterium]
MQTAIRTKSLDNGMTLIAEEMPWLQSVSFSFSLLNGCCYDPDAREGMASFVSEMVQRGCGDFDSRAYIEQLDSLGVDYSSSVTVYHTHFNGSLPAARLSDTMQVYSDLLRRPRLPANQVEDARLVCMQEVRAIEDDLAQRVMLKLRERQYGNPLGRAIHGNEASISAINYDEIVAHYESMYQPYGAILGVAGNFEWERLCQEFESLFADWQPNPRSVIASTERTVGTCHIHHESQQTHIGLAFPSVTYSSPDYFLARGAVGVLSDGMSSRLFSEIREKRGLCYSVYASLHSLKDQGSVFSYVGTGVERAQQSLDVLYEQLTKLTDGITEPELDRLRIQIRSSLVMQQESSRSRVASISGDYFHLGYARSLNDINQKIQNLSVEDINEYLQKHPPQDFNLVTLGPTPLELPYALHAATTG